MWKKDLIDTALKTKTKYPRHENYTKKNNNQAKKPNRKFNQLTILESLSTGWYVPSKVILESF